MAIDDMYQRQTNDAIQNRAQLGVVEPRPERGFSFWGTVTAPFKGAAAGAVESSAFWSEMAGVFGDVQASYNYNGMLPVGVQTESEWRPQDAKAAQDRLLTGKSWSNPVADKLRATARWMGPDPQTSGVAEQTLFQLSRVIAKAAGYSAAGGIVPGAIATGLDEGVTASDELRREGVDLKTRTELGALTGAATAAGVGLPIAGVGIKSTAALVAAGGPGLFVAQNYLARDILEHANYDKLADRYNPFDPVGLAVSTLLPAVFGGLALHGRAKAAEAAKGPEAVAPVVDNPLHNLPNKSELVDAARVQRAREIVESWNLGDDGDIRAANESLLSVMRASEQLANGVSVDVTGQIPMSQAHAARALERMIDKAEAARAELLPDAANLAEPGAVHVMRTEIDSLSTDAGVSDASIKARAKEIQAETPHTSYKQALSRARNEMGARSRAAQDRIAHLENQIKANTNAVEANRALKVMDAQIERMKADRAAIDAPATALTPLSAAMREAGRPGRARSEPSSEPNRSQRMPDEQPQAAPARVPEGVMTHAADQVVASRLARLHLDRPDAMVRLEALNDDLPLSEALKHLEREAQQEIKDADLLQVAAQCAIGAI